MTAARKCKEARARLPPAAYRQIYWLVVPEKRGPVFGGGTLPQMRAGREWLKQKGWSDPQVFVEADTGAGLTKAWILQNEGIPINEQMDYRRSRGELNALP